MSERPAAAVQSLGLVNFLASRWVTEQGGSATCCALPLDCGNWAEDFPGKCHLAAAVFVEISAGFVTLCVSRQRVHSVTKLYKNPM